MADRKITALTELTAPVAADVFPVIDVSESANANKNKKIQLTTILQNIPNGTVSSPSVGFTGDSGLTGFFRVASNEIGITTNQQFVGSFTTTGFQLGSGTPAAQLHLFSTLLIKLLNIEAGTLLVLPEPPIPSIILVIL